MKKQSALFCHAYKREDIILKSAFAMPVAGAGPESGRANRSTDIATNFIFRMSVASSGRFFFSL